MRLGNRHRTSAAEIDVHPPTLGCILINNPEKWWSDILLYCLMIYWYFATGISLLFLNFLQICFINIFLIIFPNYCKTYSKTYCGIYDCEILSHMILANSLVLNILDKYLECSKCSGNLWIAVLEINTHNWYYRAIYCEYLFFKKSLRINKFVSDR